MVGSAREASPEMEVIAHPLACVLVSLGFRHLATAVTDDGVVVELGELGADVRLRDDAAFDGVNRRLETEDGRRGNRRSRTGLGLGRRLGVRYGVPGRASEVSEDNRRERAKLLLVYREDRTRDVERGAVEGDDDAASAAPVQYSRASSAVPRCGCARWVVR